MSSKIEGITKFNSYPEKNNIVRVYDRETDELIAETTTNQNGTFSVDITTGSGIYYVVAVRESTGETQIYDMIQRNPVTVVSDFAHGADDEGVVVYHCRVLNPVYEMSDVTCENVEGADDEFFHGGDGFKYNYDGYECFEFTGDYSTGDDQLGYDRGDVTFEVIFNTSPVKYWMKLYYDSYEHFWQGKISYYYSWTLYPRDGCLCGCVDDS